MSYLAPLLVLAALIGSLSWLRFKATRSLRTGPATQPENPRDIERRLVASLVTGKLDQTSYQQAMADLAHSTGQRHLGVESAVLHDAESDPRAQLAMLGVALPEIPPKVLCWAFLLAQNGADAGALVDRLHLSPWQASTIIAGSRR